MVKKSKDGRIGSLGPGVEWNPDLKEPWLMEFEKKAVNDEKWSCIVTAAIQAEAEDEEYVQIFNEYAGKGLRKSIKTITMADVFEVLKGVEDVTSIKRKDSKKTDKSGLEKKSVEAPPGKNREVIKLAAKYASYTDAGCKLPADLMAAVLKCMILNIKEVNISQKITEAVERRRLRDEKIKSDFIRSLKPYEERSTEGEQDLPTGLKVIDDAPLDGPDLYIVLINFYDASYFAHLLTVNVPFVAIFKVMRSYMRPSSWSSVLRKSELFGKKGTFIYDFWEQLSLASAPELRNIAIIQYETPTVRRVDVKQKMEEVIFDELSWMMYIAYSIYREHQTYLQELYVQNVVLSLKPLELSQCQVYNKLCDALVTGEPNTAYLILYAMIEQVVAGVPDTEALPLAYDMKFSDFFSTASESDLSLDRVEFDGKSQKLVTPCQACRNKNPSGIVCTTLKRFSEKPSQVSESSEWSDRSTIQRNIIYGEGSARTYPSKLSKTSTDSEKPISETLIAKVLEEKKTETEIRNERKWKGPKLCFYGDYIELETYHCDPRILDPTTIFDRLIKSSVLPRLWAKYPELPPEERAYFNFHFYRFWKISSQSEDLLKLKMFFVLSMKLIGITKGSYMYRGDEEISSEIFAEKLRKISKVRFGPDNSNEKKFSNYFIRKLIAESFLRMPRKTILNLENLGRMGESLVRGGSSLLRNAISQFNIQIHRDGGLAVSHNSKRVEDIFGSSFYTNRAKDREPMTLIQILDCLDISSLTDFHIMGNREDFLNLVHKFNFYENLEASRMIQRLLEAKSNYNTTQCSYFPPTDTMMIIMYNDFDYRGVYYNNFCSSLTTPVSLKDFFAYVYPEIGHWLIKNAEEASQVRAEFQDKIKAADEEADNEYLHNLQMRFCKMTDEERADFLETGSTTTTLSQGQNVNDYAGKKLAFRFKTDVPNRISFVATNLCDVRVETRTEVHQYHSKDGTEVSVTQDSWLNEPSALLTLYIKQSPLNFYLHQYLGEINTSFSLKTDSGIRFSFFKDNDESSETSQEEDVNGLNYRVNISWPTGLLIQGKTIQGQDMYVKQSYIRVYRKKWDISEEKCRCFLKSGEVLIFKENGDVECLYGSGTICCCLEPLKSESEGSGSTKKEKSHSNVNKMASFQRYKITTPLGETWEKVSKGPCKNKKRLLNTFKVYMGVDSRNLEMFCKRDDGVYSMFWPNGKLVTNFPDGTKITSIPVWDDEEIGVEWTEEEMRHFLEVEAKRQEELSDQRPKSKTILKKYNGSSSRTSKLTLEQKSSPSFQVESFVCVSCYYLMEHPKYATVVFDPQNPSAQIKMPDGLSIQMFPKGNYQVQQGTKFLTVQGTTAQLYSECPTCGDLSTSTVSLDSDPILCRFVDILKNVFVVERTGSTKFQEREPSNDSSDSEGGSSTTKCEHVENVAAKQRCFCLQRDLTGIEFIHSDSLQSYCHTLPADTHFDLHSETHENWIKAHTFSCPYYKMGYENWVMKYEDDKDSLPTNLKKRDLKELGVKESTSKLFEYPFPKSKLNLESSNKQDPPGLNVEMPRVIVTRIVKSLGEEPEKMIDELREFVAEYQRRAYDIRARYKAHKAVVGLSKDEKDVKMKLLRIALTLNQGCHAYPHLCDIVPSTETDIHKAGHYINLMDSLKAHDRDHTENWSDCKQIQRPLPRFSNLNSILEESEPS